MESANFSSILSLCTKKDIEPLPINKQRISSSSNLLRKLIKLKTKLGITRLNYLTPLANSYIPVVSITRPNITDKQKNSSTQGKGKNMVNAFVAAIMETVEHHAANNFPLTITTSCKELKEKHLEYFCPFLQKEIDPVNHLIDWIETKNLSSDSLVLLPASLVLFPYDESNKTNFIPTCSSTTGLASGSTILEAIFFSCLEIIERDALTNFFSGGKFRYISNKELLKYPSVANILHNLIENNKKICIMQIFSKSGLPVFFTSLLVEEPFLPPLVTSGHACRINLESAILDSIFEAIQIHATVLQSGREDLIRHKDMWDSKEKNIVSFWYDTCETVKRLSTEFNYNNFNKASSIYQRSLYVLKKLDNGGCRDIYFLDITNQNIKIPVVRIYIPSMLDKAYDDDLPKPDHDYLKNEFIGIT